jgi:hypothetical protein
MPNHCPTPRFPHWWKTLKLVSRSYWWPQMSRYIGQYCSICDLCLWTKAQRHRPFGELQPLEILKERWKTISVDFIVELPEAHGYNAVMVTVDLAGKRAHFIPTYTTVTDKGSVELFSPCWRYLANSMGTSPSV